MKINCNYFVPNYNSFKGYYNFNKKNSNNL